MLASLGLLLIRRHRAVLVLTGLALALAAAIGGSVPGLLSSGGFADPAAESSVGEERLQETFGAGTNNVVLLVDAGRSVDDREVAQAGARLTKRLAEEPGVASAGSYWSLGKPDVLKSTDGTKALILGRILGDEDEVRDVIEVVAPKYRGEIDGLTVDVGGEAEIFHQVSKKIESDLTKAEAIAVPLTLVVLVLVFGSLVAALLPLAIGLVAIFGTLLVLRALTEVTDVSIFSLNLTTAMGLGLAIDYSLFMVNRYREEIAHGRHRTVALVQTMRTAGRTVLFSALTVAISLAALMVFPLYFLRSFAYAGIAVTATAAVGALIVLPALLAVLGPKVDALDLRKPLRRLFRRPPPRPVPAGEGTWHRIATAVMRRPIPVATAVTLFLLALGTPFLGASFAMPDDRVLPASAGAAQVMDTLRQEFPSREVIALQVFAPDAPAGPERTGEVRDYALDLSRVAEVERVDSIAGSFRAGRQVGPPTPQLANPEATYLTVVPAVEAYSAEGEALVKRLRAVDAPYDVLISGEAAEFADTMSSLRDRIPLALGLIAVTTILLLFLFTGSVLIPIKAIVLNLLSLSATFGAMVYVFQEGHLRWLVGDFTVTGALDATTPILMFCVLFGLSMDYEVFLLSRIKEEWERTHDNRASVALGIERTGRIITAAALLLTMVFVAFATSGITFIKLLGIGTALAVMVDATLIRGALVPAFMRLAGDANWWAPRPLRRLHDKIGLREATEELYPPETVAQREREPVVA